MSKFVSRAGEKLEFGLDNFQIDVTDKVCVDMGCSTGGFTDCLLTKGARKVIAIDTGYGVIDWKLRNDPRVEVHERTNALFWEATENIDFISVDVSWTKQKLILPKALSMITEGSDVVSLVKPHYEAGKAKMDEEETKEVFEQTMVELRNSGINIIKWVQSPILGEKGKNIEYLIWIKK